MKRLSVVIPTHHRPAATSRLVESIASQSLESDLFEVLVVTNFAEPELEKKLLSFVDRLKNLRILRAQARGANASRNLGVNSAEGGVVLFLDDDCHLNDAHYLEKILAVHEANPAHLGIGGTYATVAGSPLPDVAYNLIAQDWQTGSRLGAHESNRLIGGNVSYKREALLALGELFNPHISYGGAELEFHHRLQAKGARLLLVPELTVYHCPQIQPSDLPKKAFKQAITKVKFQLQDSALASSGRYHPQRTLRAMREARSEAELATLQTLMETYDLTYNLVVNERIDTWRRLRWRQFGWKARARA